MMRYPVAIEVGDENTAFGVVVPDLPGCCSAGDTMDEALENAEEAASGWIDAALDAGQTIPAPSSLETLRCNPDYNGWVFAIITIDPAVLDDAAGACEHHPAASRLKTPGRKGPRRRPDSLRLYRAAYVGFVTVTL